MTTVVDLYVQGPTQDYYLKDTKGQHILGFLPCQLCYERKDRNILKWFCWLPAKWSRDIYDNIWAQFFTMTRSKQNNYLRFSEIIFLQEIVTNLPKLSNLPKHIDESIHLIGGLLGHVYKYDTLKHVQMLTMSNEWLGLHLCFKYLY